MWKAKFLFKNNSWGTSIFLIGIIAFTLMLIILNLTLKVQVFVPYSNTREIHVLVNNSQHIEKGNKEKIKNCWRTLPKESDRWSRWRVNHKLRAGKSKDYRLQSAANCAIRSEVTAHTPHLPPDLYKQTKLTSRVVWHLSSLTVSKPSFSRWPTKL